MSQKEEICDPVARVPGVHEWHPSTLAELLLNGTFIDGDWVESKDQDPKGDVRLIQLADVGDGHFRNRSNRFLTKDKAYELNCTFLETGDVLVARMPEPLGRACIFPGDDKPAVTVVDVCVLRGDPSLVDQRWLMYAINAPAFRSLMEEFERGTTRKRISRKNLGLLPILVPPFQEQREIADSLDRLRAQTQSTRERLATIPTLLKKFRQSVLAAACSGQLTADWRVNLGKDDAWIESSVGHITEVCLGGTPSRKNDIYWNGKVPWVSSGEVAWQLITNTRERITEEGLANSNAKLLPKGSVLIAMIGEGKTRGQAAILGIEATTNQNVAALVPNKNIVESTFLRLWAEERYETSRSEGGGGVQEALNAKKIRAMKISLPPIEEQAEIVCRVESLFALADSIESRLAGATAQVERTTQAILAKAFRGEL